MHAWSIAPYGMPALRARVVSYWAHLFALVDKLRADTMPWVPTNSKVSAGGRFMAFQRIATISVCLLYGTGLLLCVVRMRDDYWHFIPAMFFLGFHAWVTFLALRDPEDAESCDIQPTPAS
jgi:hypothetical protein